MHDDEQYVRDSVEPDFFAKHNYKRVLVRNIFYATHKELAKKGAEWLVKTADSCSMVAGLVVTVAYTSATAAPGGNGDDVIMFLGILTSRFDEKCFGTMLPVRLFVGLSSLFFSIVAMLVSFCAGHYFLLSHRFQNATVVIYLATSLPVALFFVISQLPLFYDMLVAILSKTLERRSDHPNLPEKAKISKKVEGDKKNQSRKKEQGP
ncbi:Ankyrin-repeat containing-like protein [Cucumis melo var. makuwa]|uniref:Ankyrin-repeat containing-like protein n=1 Tax=Cucumis melo var. makuwa TaxID=1194695 RepID=A0A5D3C2P6_CUCMM|nr:Ankyrin-repeat containing-like protein [Cucumis melo var. makuwa]TYK04669.1 Ankyrin-repeat containing-like protein [Cucumis melo var. makuwa]